MSWLSINSLGKNNNFIINSGKQEGISPSKTPKILLLDLPESDRILISFYLVPGTDTGHKITKSTSHQTAVMYAVMTGFIWLSIQPSINGFRVFG